MCDSRWYRWHGEISPTRLILWGMNKVSAPLPCCARKPDSQAHSSPPRASALERHSGSMPSMAILKSPSQAASLRFCRRLAFFRHRRGIQAQEIEDDLAQQVEILGGVVLFRRTGILAEIDVENPVKPVFDGPVGFHRLGHFVRPKVESRPDPQGVYKPNA